MSRVETDGSAQPLVKIDKVSRIYRTRRHEGSFWRQLVSPTFDEYLALDGVTLDLPKGRCLGFIGPNGAGKSTLVKMMTGLLEPTSGRIEVLGHQPSLRTPAMLGRIGVVFGHKTSMWWDLPVRQSFEAVQKIYRVDRATFQQDVERLAEALNIGALMSRTVRQLSLGERVKCELALALSHRPDLLILDEPTIGVDIESKHELRALIRADVRERETAVFLTSHDVGDLLSCCNDVALVYRGRVFEHLPVDDFLDNLGANRGDTQGLEELLIDLFRSQRRSENEEIDFGDLDIDEDEDE